MSLLLRTPDVCFIKITIAGYFDGEKLDQEQCFKGRQEDFKKHYLGYLLAADLEKAQKWRGNTCQ